MHLSRQLLGLVTSAALFVSGDASPVWNPAVVTSKGSVTGTSTGSGGVRYTVPYAQPPVKDLRFQHPQPLTSFANSRSHRRFKPRCLATNSTFDGTSQPKACLQSTNFVAAEDQSEDCLYMNVFVPPRVDGFSKLPVFVWVHGGSFLTGGIAGIDGSKLAAAQNMIVVTVQYRLGIFGWLRNDPLRAEGNYGLRDLMMALQVIRDDIASFGGDASSITLAGQSSGAQMIKALLSVPSASSLFDRAIIQSAPLDYAPQSVEVANTVGKYAAQTVLNRRNWVQLRDGHGKSTNDFLMAQQNTSMQAFPGVPTAEPWNVVLDGDLVQGDGQQVLVSGKDVIFTTTSGEGCAGVESG
ncbi:hypothetical protein JCM10212_002627, partial [Sporobolomyces blumeae]